MAASTSGKVRLLTRWNGSRLIRTPHAGVDASYSCVQTYSGHWDAILPRIGLDERCGPVAPIARLDRIVVRRNPAGGNSEGPRRQRHLLAIDSGRTPTEVLTVETNATCRCDVSAWLLGENGKDG